MEQDNTYYELFQSVWFVCRFGNGSEQFPSWILTLTSKKIETCTAVGICGHETK
jgi:hypothetical protein